MYLSNKDKREARRIKDQRAREKVTGCDSCCTFTSLFMLHFIYNKHDLIILMNNSDLHVECNMTSRSDIEMIFIINDKS